MIHQTGGLFKIPTLKFCIISYFWIYSNLVSFWTWQFFWMPDYNFSLLRKVFKIFGQNRESSYEIKKKGLSNLHVLPVSPVTLGTVLNKGNPTEEAWESSLGINKALPVGKKATGWCISPSKKIQQPHF